MKLYEQIQDSQSELMSSFAITGKRWENLLKRFEKHCNAPNDDYNDEVVWTFLLCLAYAAKGADGARLLEEQLSGSFENPQTKRAFWLEALPLPPRSKEKNTNVDLALGAIRKRGNTSGGIEFDPESDSRVTFCEMKWYSDISTKVTHDQTRNQLARVIENAVTFQTQAEFPDKVTVALVTPRVFVDSGIKSRLYQYKFKEYEADKPRLLEEWKDSHDRLPLRNTPAIWTYPDENVLLERLNSLTLKHVSYESLLEAAPESELKTSIFEFAETYNQSATGFDIDL